MFFFLFFFSILRLVWENIFNILNWMVGAIAEAISTGSVVSVLMNCFYWKWSAEMIQIRQHSIYYILMFYVWCSNVVRLHEIQFRLAVVFHLFSNINMKTSFNTYYYCTNCKCLKIWFEIEKGQMLSEKR